MSGVPDLVEQVAEFQAYFSAKKWRPANTLFSIFMGINDV